MKSFIFALFMLLSPFAFAQSEDYQWFQTDLFPYVISSGPQEGTGAADLAMHLIDSLISDYGHDHITKPAKRILEDLKAGELGLWPTVIRTPERELFLQFSDPYVVINPLKFISLKSASLSEEISPDLIRQSGEYKIAIVRGRGYGSVLDQALKDMPPARITELSSLTDDFHRTYKLMESRRLTGFFAYADEVNALCAQFGIPVDDFRFSAVTGLDYIYACIAAPKTPWGASLIGRINPVLDRVKGPVAVKYSLFLPPEARDDYLKTSRKLLSY